MAFIPCKIGGSGFVESTLWTNSTPTSGFSAQTLSLSQDIDNFKYLKFVYGYSTTYNTEHLSFLISVDDFKKCLSNNDRSYGLCLTSRNSGNNFTRICFWVSDTSLSISNCYQFAGTSSNNNLVIPVQIIGMK